MPFPRPTLRQLIDQALSDIRSNLPGADPLLRFSNLNVLANAVAALANGQYGYQDWIAKQSNPWTATEENLEAWAALKGIVRIPSSTSAGVVTFSGITGTNVPAGSSLVRGDGVEYTTDALVTIGGGGTITAAITAVEAGAAGNAVAGTTLTLGSAISGINSAADVTTACTGGADTETDDSLRDRMLEAYAHPPQGGSKRDYQEWARAVPGVTRAWCEPNGMGSGTVVLRFMMDVTNAAFDGFPQGTDGVATDESRDTVATGDQLAVADYIFDLQPVGALVYCVAPVDHPINFTITNTGTWSAATKAAVESAIDASLLEQGVPGETLFLSFIEAAIAAVAGTAGFLITVPAANVTQTAGQLPTRGTVTFA